MSIPLCLVTVKFWPPCSIRTLNTCHLAEKESFETNLNTEGYYFGLSLVENEKGQIELASSNAGSPAWNSGELNQGDILLELKGEGNAPIELNGASQEEVSQILDGYNKGRLEFTVRKPDGIIKKVWLAKEKIRNDDNGVKGFILKGANRVGYIYLPGFYTDFQVRPSIKLCQ